MVPSQWVRLDVMPRNSSGKLDRRSLPKPDGGLIEKQSTYVAPNSEAETILAQICAEVLGQGRVSVQDNLLSLGADSIHIFQIVARANQAGLALSAKTLLQNHTIAKAAATIAVITPPADGPELPQLVRVARTGRRVSGGAGATVRTLQSPER
jgi:aryl carrier-like protein